MLGPSAVLLVSGQIVRGTRAHKLAETICRRATHLPEQYPLSNSTGSQCSRQRPRSASSEDPRAWDTGGRLGLMTCRIPLWRASHTTSRPSRTGPIPKHLARQGDLGS